MTIDQRFEQISTQLNILTLKTSSHDDELNQLTKNLNELTLKVDVFASQLREGQQQLETSYVRLAGVVNTVLDMQASTLTIVRELTAIVDKHEGRIRQLES